jgi:transcriptional regulator with XRE-family HTH domain
LRGRLRNLDDEARRLGRVLQELRLRRGLTQAQLAARVGYTQRAISDLENGNTNVHAVVLYHIAKALQVDPIELCMSVWPNDDLMLQTDRAQEELLLLVKQIPPERRDLAKKLLLQLR